MSVKKFRKPLTGIVPPMVTPLLDNDTLDVQGLERLIEHIIAGGVHGLFLLGTTGEAPSLSYKLRHELLERACRQVKGRVPVLAGITDASFTESLNMARKAADYGVDALVLAPPYYFPAGQPELLEYLEHLIPKLPLPLFLYNMPTMTKLSIAPETIERVMDIPNMIGIKDSSCDMIYFHRLMHLLRGRPDLSLLIGPEEMLAESVLLGGHGGVNGGANFFPKLYVDLYHAALRKDIETVQALHRKVISIRATVYSIGKYSSGGIKAIKCALNCMGICSDFMAEPFHRFRDSERAILQKQLVELGLVKDS